MTEHIDFAVEDHGSVVTFDALTEGAQAELEFMGLEDWQFVGHNKFAIDRSLAWNLMDMLIDNGFVVQ